MANKTTKWVEKVMPLADTEENAYGLLFVKGCVEESEDGRILSAYVEEQTVDFKFADEIATAEDEEQEITEIMDKFVPEEERIGPLNIREEIKEALDFLDRVAQKQTIGEMAKEAAGKVQEEETLDIDKVLESFEKAVVSLHSVAERLAKKGKSK